MRGHELAMAIRAAYLEMHRRTDALLAPSGVTADQFVVLATLADGDALTQRDLVARTSSDPSTLRAMLVLLERRRLIERRPHPSDGRARSVSLTRRGRSVFRQLWRKSEALRRRIVTAFLPDEIDLIVAQLSRIATVMATDRATPSGRGFRGPARAALSPTSQQQTVDRIHFE
jgi:DNA-binding MarR family transcriptional regulator